MRALDARPAVSEGVSQAAGAGPKRLMANLGSRHYYGTGGKTKRGVCRNPRPEWRSMLDLNQRPRHVRPVLCQLSSIDRDASDSA